MIQLRNVSKRFGDVTAVDDLSFDVPAGLVTGFLGPNGSGKSTTMRMILGLDRPDTGTVRIAGREYRTLPAPLTVVGALLEARSVHPGRTARNHLRALAAADGLSDARVDEVLTTVGLHSVADRRAGSFSMGMGQRLGIAGALLGDPPVLLFDEPVNGLDPEGILWVRDLLRRFAAEGRTVLVSSHLMTEMSLAADRLIVVGRGRLVADTTVTGFIGSRGLQSVFVASGDDRAVTGLFPDRAAVAPGGGVLVRGLRADEVGDAVFAAGIPVHELSPRTPTLEEVFLSSTSGSVEFRPGQGEADPPPASAPAAVQQSLLPDQVPDDDRTIGAFAELPRLLRAEWRKLVSLRSSVAALGGTFVLCVAFAAIAAAGTVARWEDMNLIRRLLFDPTALGVGGAFFAQLVLGSLGVLVMTGEYSTGTIRATLGASPRRLRVLTAKVIVFAGAALVVSLATTFVSFLVCQAVLSQIGINSTLAQAHVPRSIAGAAMYLVLIGLLGLGLGTIIRHTAGAISTLFGIVLVLPLMVRFLPDDWAAAISPYLPLTAGRTITQVVPNINGFSPAVSLGLVAGYAAVALLVGGVVLRTRDA